MVVIELKQVMARIGAHFTLTLPAFSLLCGENWLVTGPNSSGKSAFGRLLAGQLDFTGDAVFSMKREIGKALSYLSPDLEKKLFLNELRNDDSEFIEGGVDFGRTAQEIMLPDEIDHPDGDALFKKLVDIFQVQHILQKGFRFLSSGETRKALIIRALLHDPELLILDDPFSGLDRESRTALNRALAGLMKSGLQVVLITPPSESPPHGVNRILVLEQGGIAIQGEREAVLRSEPFRRLLSSQKPVPDRLPDPLTKEASPNIDTLVSIKDLSVSYYGRMVFRNLDWIFRTGEHWSILGPNGSGKSTLLSMISGDNPKAYGKAIWIFGRKRGTGESIWDIKKHLGVVSPEFHRNYRAGGSLLSVVISGFFDSIGVYDAVAPAHMKIAREWLHMAGLEKEEKSPFDRLSFGYQRVALILRAMVKHPLLLILDEPCHGLDVSGRALVLNLMEAIARHGKTHLLHVTHDPLERTAAITHRLIFEKRADGVHEAVAERIFQP